MPLLDHFHPPLQKLLPWESVHAAWATRLADSLNERWLPPEYLAIEHTHVGHLEVDLATFESAQGRSSANGPAVATLPRTYSPPAPAHTLPALFPENFEVRIHRSNGFTLVGAIELISPANKDRPTERLAFATKCASYLYQGISLVIIDIVTSRRANLHNELMRLMGLDRFNLPEEMVLYAAAYRPVLREEQPQIDLWSETCSVGSPLPVMPLRLTADLFVPVEFDATYEETCRRRRLT